MAIATRFGGLAEPEADPLLKMIPLFQADARPEKLDLGVGVYRDEAGRTPILAAVKAAEIRLLQTETTKAYLGAEGDVGFTRALGDLVLGAHMAQATGLQTPGGTAALRLALDLAARVSPGATVFMGAPTWPNHPPLAAAAGLVTRFVPYFDATAQSVDFDAMTAALDAARPGDIVLLQATCHNPTGADLTPAQFAGLARFCADRALLPLIDVAYLGLGGGLENDAAGLRALLTLCPEALIAVSGSKSFGLYRERVGAVYAVSPSAEVRRRAQGALLSLARGAYSMPPSHGASIVRLILESADLAASWRAELASVQMRIAALRHQLAAWPPLAALGRQHGMFSTLALSAHAIERLREEHAIYLTDAGRMNIAGLGAADVPRLFAALSELGELS